MEMFAESAMQIDSWFDEDEYFGHHQWVKIRPLFVAIDWHDLSRINANSRKTRSMLLDCCINGRLVSLFFFCKYLIKLADYKK